MNTTKETIISFKQFAKDVRNYYDLGEKGYFRIEDEQDMDDTIDEIYETKRYEMDYEQKIITLFN